MLYELGQVFTPRETHLLEFIDLEMRLTLLWPLLPLSVYACDDTGQPLGNHISSSASYHIQKEIILIPTRVRFRMTRTLLQEGQHYIIVLRHQFPLIAEPSWGNDKDDQTYYPRGWRMHHLVGTPTWTPYYNQCHIFAEFGTPPLPKPEPEPPIENFAIPLITYTHWDIGLVIRLPTSVPCHLTCYYTDKKPLKHHRSRVIRGLDVPWATYFCFVAWKTVEQTEIGDTMYHTFHFPDWLEGQTKWFTFKGEVDLSAIPSIGPIFEHTHPGGLPRIIILRPNAPGDLCTIWEQVGAFCPGHYLNVDDEIPDEDTTYIFNRFGATNYRSDLYNIPTATFGKIDSLRVYSRMKRIGGYAYAFSAYILIKTHGTTYRSIHYSSWGTSWSTVSFLWTTNPFTGLPWTQEEINDLQIGITLRCYWGVGWATYSACTQLYAEVTRGIEGGPD